MFRQVSTWDPSLVSAIRRHYTGSRGAPPGKKMAWVVSLNGQDVAWYGLGEPAYKLAPRRRLGLTDARPLEHTVCDFIYRLETRELVASELLAELQSEAAHGWAERYGWEPVHWETLVQPNAVATEVPGYCYRRIGYRSLGYTTGRSARRPPGNTHGPRVWSDAPKKLVLYRGPLRRVPI